MKRRGFMSLLLSAPAAIAVAGTSMPLAPQLMAYKWKTVMDPGHFLTKMPSSFKWYDFTDVPACRCVLEAEFIRYSTKPDLK